MSKQAIIYTRFSPRPDADTSKSCESQEERCIIYCGKQNYTIIGVFDDKNISGKTVDREGLNSALSHIDPGMILVVDSPDRLARDQLVFLTIQAEVERLGASIEFANGSANDISSPEGKLIRNIFGAFSQYERDRIAFRTKLGLAKKKEKGEWIGRPPYGYKKIKGKKELEIDEFEQFNIEAIMWMANIDNLCPASIAQELNRRCLCRRKMWSARMIKKIIEREKMK
jgi:site-specific DNA recombinase